MDVFVKICGLKTPEAVTAAIDAGADMLGFVFFEKSPRNVSLEHAKELIKDVPENVETVALLVDPDDALVEAVAEVGVDVIQLHGHESPMRVIEVKARSGLPVMKALPIANLNDVVMAHEYEAIADALLFDAKPPEGADLPGGNAVSFDWSLLTNEVWTKTWLLAGGLDADNVAEAISVSGTRGVDVSSGVEDAPGEKSIEKIRAFIRAAKAT